LIIKNFILFIDWIRIQVDYSYWLLILKQVVFS